MSLWDTFINHIKATIPAAEREVQLFGESAGQGLTNAIPYVADVVSAGLNPSDESTPVPVIGELPTNLKEALIGKGKRTTLSTEGFNQANPQRVAPANEAERIVSSVGQGVGGGILGGASGVEGLVGGIVSGAAGGAGAEAAHAAFPNSDWAPLIGGIVGGAGPHVADALLGGTHEAAPVNETPEPSPAIEPQGPPRRPAPDGLLGNGSVRPVAPEELARIMGDSAAVIPPDHIATADGNLSGYDTLPQNAKALNDALAPKEPTASPEEGPDGPSTPPTSPGGLFQEISRDKDGNIFLNYQPDPSKPPIPIKMGIDDGTAELAIDQFGKNANQLGPAKIRTAMTDLMGMYPEIKRFGGFRRSGAGAGRVQEIIPPETPSKVLTPSEAQEMDASAPKPVVDNTGYEAHTPYVEPPTPANDATRGAAIKGTIKRLLTDESGVARTEPTEPETSTPEDKLAQAIYEVRPTSIENRTALHQIRVEQAARLQKIQQRGGRLPEQLRTLQSDFTPKDYESISQHFSPEEVAQLEQKINTAKGLSAFDKLNVHKILNKILDPAGMTMPTEHELDQLADVFSPKVVKAVLSRMGGRTNTQLAAAEIGGIPRTLKATADISAPGRQGILFIGRKEFWKNYPKMIRMMFSQKYFDAQMEGIKNSPNYDLMRYGKLAVRDSPLLQDREEFFLSRLPEKFPILGHIVKGSDRAYTGFLRKLRADVFDSLIEKGKEAGVDWHSDPAKIKALARFVNTATGRGDLGEFENAAEAFSAAFFAPRFVKSRLDTLGVGDVANALRGKKGYYGELYSADPFIAKEAAKSLASFAGLYGLALALAVAGGAKVEGDLRSADGLKLRIGNTRIGFGGFPPYSRLFAQLATDKTKTEKGKLISLSSGKYGSQTRFDVASNFLFNKLSPVPGIARDVLKGTDPGGNKATVSNELAQGFVPMSVQDTVDSLKLNGPKGAWVAIPSILGADVATYNPRPTKGKSKNVDPLTRSGADPLTRRNADPFKGAF